MFGIKLRKLIKDLTKEVDDLRRELAQRQSLVEKNTELYSRNTQLTSKNRKLTKKVREQTEADLFFASAKIQKDLLDGKTKKEVEADYSRIWDYQRQLQQLQAQSSFPSWNLLQGLGNPLGWGGE